MSGWAGPRTHLPSEGRGRCGHAAPGGGAGRNLPRTGEGVTRVLASERGQRARRRGREVIEPTPRGVCALQRVSQPPSLWSPQGAALLGSDQLGMPRQGWGPCSRQDVLDPRAGWGVWGQSRARSPSPAVQLGGPGPRRLCQASGFGVWGAPAGACQGRAGFCAVALGSSASLALGRASADPWWPAPGGFLSGWTTCSVGGVPLSCPGLGECRHPCGGPLGTRTPPWAVPGGGWADPVGCTGHACLSQGKQKYTLPLYHAMVAGGPAARALAEETFAATAAQLHGNVVRYVQQILAPTGS